MDKAVYWILVAASVMALLSFELGRLDGQELAVRRHAMASYCAGPGASETLCYRFNI